MDMYMIRMQCTVRSTYTYNNINAGSSENDVIQTHTGECARNALSMHAKTKINAKIFNQAKRDALNTKANIVA